MVVFKWLFIPEPEPESTPVPVQKKPLSLYQQTAAELTDIPGTRIGDVYSSDLSIVTVVLYKKTIWEYIDFLKYINRCMDTSVQVPASMMRRENTEIYLRDFFQDRENNFVHPAATYAHFLECALEFINHCERLETAHDKPFVVEKNLTLTYGIINDLRAFCRSFD